VAIPALKVASYRGVFRIVYTEYDTNHAASSSAERLALAANILVEPFRYHFMIEARSRSGRLRRGYSTAQVVRQCIGAVGAPLVW